MRRMCCSKFHRGDRLMGMKEPLEDDRETHGLCPLCVEREVAEYEKLAGVLKTLNDFKEETRWCPHCHNDDLGQLVVSESGEEVRCLRCNAVFKWE